MKKHIIIQTNIFNKLFSTGRIFTKNSTVKSPRLQPEKNHEVYRPDINQFLTEEEIQYINKFPQPSFKYFLAASSLGLNYDELNCPICGSLRPLAPNNSLRETCKNPECKKKLVSRKVSETKQNFSEERKREINQKHVDYYQSHYGEGITNPMQLESTKEKFKNTMVERYGVEHALQNKDIYAKLRFTLNENYGVSNPTYISDHNEKSIKTCREKYGVDNYSQTEEYKQKIKETSLREYGCEHFTQNPEVIKRNAQTKIERYGSASYNNKEKTISTMIKNIKESKPEYQNLGDEEALFIARKINARKSFESNLRNHNGVHNLASEEARKIHFVKMVQRKSELMKDIDWNSKDFDIVDSCEVKCRTCNNTYNLSTVSPNDIKSFACPNCHPYESSKYASKFEFEVSLALESLGLEFEANKYFTEDGKKRQLDFYIPSHNLAIECDGLYWHSFDPYNKNPRITKKYHLEKTEFCEKKGIHLMHIFENEWINKKEIVIDIIKRYLNKTHINYARNFYIKNIDNQMYKDFLEKNHIQGYTPASIKIGLFSKENELISVMSFAKSRYNKGYNWELIRYCERLNEHVVGGKNKLFKYFAKNHKGDMVVSYCDRRYFNGNSYKNLGFEFKGHTKPSYFYWKSNFTETLYNRINFQKHKLPQILDRFDSNLTEMENMYENGYFAIYDCGQRIFVKEI